MPTATSMPATVYRGHRGKMLALAAMLVVGIYLLISAGEQEDETWTRLSYLASMLCGLLLVGITVLAARREPKLKLDQDGFHLTSMWGDRHYLWAEHAGYRLDSVLWFEVLHFYRVDHGSDLGMLNLFDASGDDLLSELVQRSESVQKQSESGP